MPRRSRSRSSRKKNRKRSKRSKRNKGSTVRKNGSSKGQYFDIFRAALSKPLYVVEKLFTDVDNKLFEDEKGTINIVDFDIDEEFRIVNPTTQKVKGRRTLEQPKPYTLHFLKNLLRYERDAPKFQKLRERIHAIVNQKPPKILPMKDIVEVKEHKVPTVRDFRIGDVVQGKSENTFTVLRIEDDRLIFAESKYMKKENANIVVRGLVAKQDIPAGTLITLYPTDEVIQKNSRFFASKQKVTIDEDYHEDSTYEYNFDAALSESAFRIHVRPSAESISNPKYPYLGHLVNGIKIDENTRGFFPRDPDSNCCITEFYSKSAVGVFALIDIKKGTPLLCSYSKNYIF